MFNSIQFEYEDESIDCYNESIYGAYNPLNPKEKIDVFYPSDYVMIYNDNSEMQLSYISPRHITINFEKKEIEISF